MHSYVISITSGVSTLEEIVYLNELAGMFKINLSMYFFIGYSNERPKE